MINQFPDEYSAMCHYKLDNFFTFKHPFFSIAPEIKNTSNPTDPIIVDATDNTELDQLTKRLWNDGYENVIYLTSNINESNGNDIIYFPAWLYSSSLVYSQLHRVEILSKRNYLVSCLNRNCFPHKIYTYLQFLKREYISKSAVSFSNSYCVDAQLTPLDFSKSPFVDDLPKDIIDEAKKLSLYREIPNDNEGWSNDHSLDNLGFTDSYLNITTETRHRYSLFTEKTAKTLAAGQLFLQVNGLRSLDGLRTLGLNTFDTVFDGHQYDTESNFIDRIDKMFLLLDSIVPNLEDIYNDNISAIRDNQDYFLSESFRSRMEKNLSERDLIL
jgi:hypothetical protein